MSSLWHPVGPAGAGTYWRRRLVLLAVLAIPVVAAALLLTRGGEPAAGRSVYDAMAAAPTSAPAGAGPGGSPSPAGSSSSSSSSSTTSPDGDPGRPCEPAELRVGVRTDAVSYGPDARPRLTLTVESTAGTSCTVRLGSDVERFTVTTAAGQPVWSSAHCAVPADGADEVLAPGESTADTVQWTGARSAEGCPGDQARAGTGDYVVTAALGDRTSAPATFSVR